MSKTKIIKPYSDAIATTMQRELMKDTDAYHTVNSDP